MKKTLTDSEQIEEAIYLSIKDKVESIKEEELRNFIKEEITKRNYLVEDWHIDYAVERIEKRLKSKRDIVERTEVFDKNPNPYRNQTKILLILGFGIQILYFITRVSSNALDILDKYGFSAFAGRIIGEFIGVFFPASVASLLVSIPIYYIRKSKSCMRYIDYPTNPFQLSLTWCTS